MKDIYAPPSKSITHRAIICASLCDGTSKIKNPLLSDDTKRTLQCCIALGARCVLSNNQLEIKGIEKKCHLNKKVELNVGESGTTCRLITPIVSALRGIEARIYGEGRMHERPIGELLDVLSSLGTEVFYEDKQGFPPFRLRANGLKVGTVGISLEKSSQYLSGLLLASPLACGIIKINIIGKKAVSWPYVGLTIEAMKKFGVDVSIYEKQGRDWFKRDITEIAKVEPGHIKFIVKPGQYRPCEFFIEGDWSNASYLVAAGLLMEGGLKIHGLLKNSLQGDKKILDILKKMGARMSWEKDALVVYPSRLHGIDINMKDCPDLVPTVAVLASMAESKTTISGVEHLRLKESDRLNGVATEVKKVGAKVELFKDGLGIDPRELPVGREILFTTYGDHRMAMSLSLYEFKGIKVKLDNKRCVAKSFPDFFDVFEKLKN